MDNEFIANVPIQFFSKNNGIGINLIQNPAKIEIVSYLLDSELSSAELSDLTGKSKSTLSSHLNSLVDLGIVNFRIDSKDHRKKIFFIDSKFLGEINPSNKNELEEIKVNYLIENIIDVDNFKLSLLLFHTLRSILIQEGININPILEVTGKKVGLAIYEKVHDDDIHEFIKNVEEFWFDHGMGNLEIILNEVIQINNFDCFECALLPKQDEGACFLDRGILWALFSSYLGFEVIVDEYKCYSLGDDRCSFSVKLTNTPFEVG